MLLQRMSANERLAQRFLKRALPLGWSFEVSEKEILLNRKSPVYLLSVAPQDKLTQSKAKLLERAKNEGAKKNCIIRFQVERHDDKVLVLKKLRLYQGIKRSIADTAHRLKIRQHCNSLTLAECAQVPGEPGEAAQEFLVTQKILIEKLELTPLYRIGTLYLYPMKNQCVTPQRDWYVTNTEFPETLSLFPLEAQDEIATILRNFEDILLSE